MSCKKLALGSPKHLRSQRPQTFKVQCTVSIQYIALTVQFQKRQNPRLWKCPGFRRRSRHAGHTSMGPLSNGFQHVWPRARLFFFLQFEIRKGPLDLIGEQHTGNLQIYVTLPPVETGNPVNSWIGNLATGTESFPRKANGGRPGARRVSRPSRVQATRTPPPSTFNPVSIVQLMISGLMEGKRQTFHPL